MNSGDPPRTEEGLQAAMERLAQARSSGDEPGVGQALLQLAFLVKWVRSDNDQPPFERSHALALEALEVFRNLDDRRGEIDAVLLAVPFEPPGSAAAMLDRAEQLATAIGDDLQSARVLAARSRHLSLRDREQAKAVALEALERFRRLGKASGMAGCLFTLAILPGTDAEKLSYAHEAARLFLDAGNASEASKALVVAIMNVGDPSQMAALEPDIRLSLAAAQESGDRFAEARCYELLARAAEARGDAGEAARCLRWARGLDESDGLTPKERWESHVETAKTLVALARRMGDDEGVRCFQAELRRLKREGP